MDLKQFDSQKGVRDNCEDMKNTLSDLYKWEQDIKDKEKNKKNFVENNEKLPGIRSNNVDQYDKTAMKLDSVVADFDILSERKVSSQSSPQSKKELANISKEKGNSEVKFGNYEGAILYYTEAISKFELDSVFYTNRAFCYLKLEKYYKCIEDCNIAINLAPTSIKAFYRRMLAYESLGNLEKSLSDCITVLNLDPGNLDAKKSQDRIKKRKNNFGFNLSRSFQNISAGHMVLDPTWTETDGYMKDIPALIKAPHLRSKKLLKRIAIEELQGDEDTNKNEITDEIIDKLFNSNDCGSFKQIDTKDRKTNITFPDKRNDKIYEAPKTQAQFYATWKELTTNNKYFYLRQINPANIVKILGAGFEIETLSEILSIISDYYLNDKSDVSVLVELCKHEGMSILSMFLSDADHQALKAILRYMRTNNYDDAKIQFVNKKFGTEY